MKKVLFYILILFAFITHVNALKYTCEITGDEEIYSNSDKTSYIKVNIDNITEVSSLRMYIKYESDLYKVDKCQFLNYTTGNCSLRTNDDSLIFHDYNYSKDYSLEDYPFFYVNFISNENTPEEGTTKITVYFEDAKDKDNKNITIQECSKELSFKKGNDTKVETSDTLNITITGYTFKFDENTLEYDLNVDSEINSLDINISAPDTYKTNITGATDLNSFGNKVIISIIDDEENEKEYTINVIREKEDIQQTSIKKDIKNKVKSIKDYIPFIIGFIIGIIIIMIIIHKKDNKKMDKYLDNL